MNKRMEDAAELQPITKNPVIRPRICRQCGKTFDGGPRAWYCPDCRSERKKASLAKYRAKGRRADRPIGSMDRCTVCGKEYIVNSARQKYCPNCAYEAVRAVDRTASRKWNQAHKETYYPEKNAKRNAQRKADPEPIRKKEREYRARKRKSGDDPPP